MPSFARCLFGPMSIALVCCTPELWAAASVELRGARDPAEQAGQDSIRTAVEQAVIQMQLRQDAAPQQAAQAAAEVVGAARLFAAGNVNDYRAYVDERLIDEGLFAQQANAAEFWKQTQQSFVGFQFGTEGIEVRPWRLGDLTFAYEADRRTSKWRSEGRAPTLEPDPSCPIEQFEVLFTARLNDVETGLPFIARTSFVIQRDCALDRWTLVGVAVYDRPPGVKVALPSF